MRTIKELEQAALTLRNRLLQEGKYPLDGIFHVTQEEQLFIKAEPPFNYVLSNPERDRFCGLKLATV